ncbi:MAG: hypothetical protein V4858_03730 [Pseudomonadota bacterium]
MKYAPPFAIVAILSGCTAVAPKIAADMQALPVERGVVLFSTGADKTRRAYYTGLTLLKAGSQKMYDKAFITIDYPLPSHFPTEHAHVRTLRLPAGDYYLVPNGGNPHECLGSKQFPTYRFTVTNGSVSYIGSFQIAANQLKPTGSNMRRDVQYFKDKNPKLSTQKIDQQNVIVGSSRTSSCEESFPFAMGITWDTVE